MALQTGISLAVLLVVMVTRTLGVPALRQADDPGECMDSNGNVCSSRGLCICGKCKCPEMFSGPRCESISPGNCVVTKPCVQCAMFGSGPLDQQSCHDTCFEPSPPYSQLIQSIQFVDELDPNQRLCLFRDEDNCILQYTYQPSPRGGSQSHNLHIAVKAVLECPSYPLQ